MMITIHHQVKWAWPIVPDPRRTAHVNGVEMIEWRRKQLMASPGWFWSKRQS